MDTTFNQKGQSLVLGFDLTNKIIKVMAITKDSVSTAFTTYLPLINELNTSEELHDAIDSGLKELIEKHQPDVSNVTVVLPNKFVSVDYFNIPAMAKAAMSSALKVKVNEIFKNNAELNYNDLAINVTKKFSTYIVTLIRKDVVSAVMKAFSKNKAGVKAITFASNATVNAVNVLRPKLKHNNYIFVDVKEDETLINIISKDRTLGYTTLPFGYRILKSDRVLNEQLLFNHDIATLAVINAKEYAKMKKIKTFMLEEEQDETATEENQDTSSTATELDAFGNEVSLAKKFIKKLPKSMQRPRPEDEQGFIYENFRPILKRILLYKQFNEQNEHLPNPEFVVMNIPAQFSFLIEKLNEEEDENKIAFRPFNVDDEENSSINENLDLLGGNFAKIHNKNNNF